MITIITKNPNDLPDFVPVEGQWRFQGSGDRSRDSIESAIRKSLKGGFPTEIHLYQADGSIITGDIPSEGTFLVTRVWKLDNPR